MKLDDRVSKLELGRRPAKVEHDFSKLEDDELRLIASLPMAAGGEADLSGLSDAALVQLEHIMTKLEQQRAPKSPG